VRIAWILCNSSSSPATVHTNAAPWLVVLLLVDNNKHDLDDTTTVAACVDSQEVQALTKRSNLLGCDHHCNGRECQQAAGGAKEKVVFLVQEDNHRWANVKQQEGPRHYTQRLPCLWEL
jgi:hypothetical protein